MSAEITRRKFIKTAAVTTGAGALGGAALAAQMTSAAAQDLPAVAQEGTDTAGGCRRSWRRIRGSDGRIPAEPSGALCRPD